MTLAFKFGLVFAVGAAFLILLPSIKNSVATGNYSVLFMGILMLTYFSTFNGMANIPDVYHVMALFCLVLNLLGERTSKKMTLSTPQSVTLSARRVYEMVMPSVNSNAPLVSVVIPTYSRSDMLTRALESVNSQTYSKIEIVVVDDNGKGTNQQLETQARVLAFETRPGVELRYVVREKNGGGSLARNTGIDASKADFVAFLDDDDEFLPRKLELQMEPMSDPNVSLTYAHCKGVQSDGTEIYYRRVCNGVPVFEQAYCGCIAATSQWLARKDALRSVGCFSDTPAKQDSILMFKLLIAGFQIRCVPEVLSVYYDDLGTVRISTSGKSLAGELNYDRLIREYSGVFTLNQRRRVEHAMHYRVGMMLVGMNASAEGAVQLLSSFALAPFAFIHKAYRVVGHNAKQALKKLNAHRG